MYTSHNELKRGKRCNLKCVKVVLQLPGFAKNEEKPSVQPAALTLIE